jgi:hypothetical protein
MADDDECALERRDQLVTIEGAHAGMLPRSPTGID